MVAILIMPTQSKAQIDTTSLGGMKLIAWHPAITQAWQYVSDTIYNSKRSRCVHYNSTNTDASVTYEINYDTLRNVPGSFQVIAMLSQNSTAPSVTFKIEFINGDTIQSTYAPVIPKTDNFEMYDPHSVNSDGPKKFNCMRITLGYFFSGAGSNNLFLAQIRGIYGQGDTVLLENFKVPPVFNISRNTVNFDTIAIGNSLSDTLMVTNTGEIKLNLISVTSSNTSFNVSPTSTIAQPFQSTIFTLNYSPTQAETVTANIIFTHDGESSPDTVVVSGAAYVPDSVTIMSFKWEPGWQMISLPEIPHPESFVPNDVYAYERGYKHYDTMETGKGYWYKMIDSNLIYFGQPFDEATINLLPKWNIVGGISYSVAVGDLIVPSNITLGNFYGYTNQYGYQVADTLKPGRAYWVKSSDTGQVVVTVKSLREIATSLASLTSRNDNWTRVRIMDDGERPPAPPSGEIRNPKSEIPKETTLLQNYPNPFNPSTSIKFEVISSQFVTLKVYNILGEEVMELVNKVMESGSHEVTFDASKLNSGIYFYRLHTVEELITKKMLLLK
ncbi:MAG: T9SS type A sorting domain-containing protein [Patescibacteria group bacterium]